MKRQVIRDDYGNIVYTSREEEVKRPIDMLLEFSLGLVVVGLVIVIIL